MTAVGQFADVAGLPIKQASTSICCSFNHENVMLETKTLDLKERF